MGSRRIFTPQFKLQVLESYRNDNDCKGNQRATARKYNIHRRQIQKWLQCESSLRSSVANINQSTVRHQFHNINMQPPQHQQPGQQQKLAVVPTIVQHAGVQSITLDSPRQTVALNTIMVPALTQGVVPSSSSSQEAFTAANLAAVVAAAAVASAAEAMAIASSSTTNEYKRVNSDLPEKQTKRCVDNNNESKECLKNSNKMPEQQQADDEDVEIEVDIEEEEKIHPPSKPIKLFKPYLLDDDEYNNSANDKKLCEIRELNSWVSCSSSNLSPNCYDSSNDISTANNFQMHGNDMYGNAIGSPNFLPRTNTKSTSPPSAFSPTTSVPTLSPSNFQCPKGSPVPSGYESCSSTYSDTSSSSRSEASFGTFIHGRTYSLNFQMHQIYNDNLMLQQPNHIQRWLDQESSNPPATTSSIALYA
uniref:BrkDBD domain-containing protein n=1 Tax=Glossina austeni TaxID=7395 RepID=A0A1A9UUX7_GLOAU